MHADASKRECVEKIGQCLFGRIVDGIVKFVGGFIKTLSWPLRLIETGYTQNYALVMILGVLIFIGYVLWGTP